MKEIEYYVEQCDGTFDVMAKWGLRTFGVNVLNHKENAELITKILNDDENGVSSVYKAYEQYKGVDVI